MKRLFYPAVFHPAEEGGYWISFPDFPGVFTQGEDMEDSYQMCVDALGLAVIENGDDEFPAASRPEDIDIDNDSRIVLIDFDLDEYKRRINSAAVKKTLSIPGWLNEAAVKAGINFSAVLQKALKMELNL